MQLLGEDSVEARQRARFAVLYSRSDLDHERRPDASLLKDVTSIDQRPPATSPIAESWQNTAISKLSQRQPALSVESAGQEASRPCATLPVSDSVRCVLAGAEYTLAQCQRSSDREERVEEATLTFDGQSRLAKNFSALAR
jgi:hypothetical protein